MFEAIVTIYLLGDDLTHLMVEVWTPQKDGSHKLEKHDMFKALEVIMITGMNAYPAR